MSNLSERIRRSGNEVISILNRDRFFVFGSQPQWLQEKATSAAQMWLQHLSFKLKPISHLQQRRLWHSAQFVYQRHVDELLDVHNNVLDEKDCHNERYLLQALSQIGRCAGQQIDNLICCSSVASNFSEA